MPTAIEIETIVRVVVERLRGLQPAQVMEQSSPQTKLVTVNNKPQESKTLSLDSRLVTLERLRGRLSGIEIVEVADRAIVTPAVVDELRDRGVRLHRRAANTSIRSVDSAAERVLVMASQAAVDQQQALEAITRHLRDSRNVAIWSSKRPYAAAIAASSNPSVKALQLSSPAEFERAMSEAKPNLLVVDERHWTPAAIAWLARNWSERSL